MENENTEKEKSTVLRCSAFGDLRPADICGECENCDRNARFADNGGLPAMLLTGSRENLANALRAPGVAMDDVVVVNAKRFQAMEDALKKIAEYEIDPDDFESCEQAGGYLKSVAREALEVNG